jgi:3D (Asp-Asp-Asp) domain-containing protein
MTALALAVALLLAPAPLPEDPLVAHARAVVAGEIPADAWKIARYQQALDEGVRMKGRCKQTRYCLRCDPSNESADGTKPLYVGMCAANPEIPMHSVLWVQGYGLLRVRDRGGAVKLGRYVRRGETANVDVFVGDRCPGGCDNGTKRQVPYAILGK